VRSAVCIVLLVAVGAGLLALVLPHVVPVDSPGPLSCVPTDPAQIQSIKVPLRVATPPRLNAIFPTGRTFSPSQPYYSIAIEDYARILAAVHAPLQEKEVDEESSQYFEPLLHITTCRGDEITVLAQPLGAPGGKGFMNLSVIFCYEVNHRGFRQRTLPANWLFLVVQQAYHRSPEYKAQVERRARCLAWALSGSPLSGIMACAGQGD